MAKYLADVDAVPGRLYPLVPTLLELSRRGHQVTVKAGIDDIERLRSVGLRAEPLATPIERFEPDDWKARTRFGALMSGLRQFGERARAQADDLTHAIADVQPDVLFIDEGAWGAAAAAERSGLPWAFSLVSAIPLTSRDVPPFGLGLRPRHDAVGRLRDRVLGRLTLRTLERIHRLASEPDARRAGRAAVQQDHPVLARSRPRARVHRRAVRISALGLARARSGSSAPDSGNPPAEPPPWLADIHRPLVLVTCSTLFQNDRKIPQIACEAFDGEPLDAVITAVEIDPAGFTPPANVRIERFVPHSPVLDRAACVVCHAGMGISQKAFAHGVHVVAVPFGRDQPEVARRVEVARAGVRLPASKLTPTRLREGRTRRHRAPAREHNASPPHSQRQAAQPPPPTRSQDSNPPRPPPPNRSRKADRHRPPRSRSLTRRTPRSYAFGATAVERQTRLQMHVQSASRSLAPPGGRPAPRQQRNRRRHRRGRRRHRRPRVARFHETRARATGSCRTDSATRKFWEQV